jgi:hypothetical protein
MKKPTTTAEPKMMEVLIEYTETFLMPLLDERFGMIDKKFEAVDSRFKSIDQGFVNMQQEFKVELGLFRHELKDYINTKLADTTADLIKRLDRREKAIKFERKVTSIFKENHIGTKKDIAYLESLA